MMAYKSYWTKHQIIGAMWVSAIISDLHFTGKSTVNSDNWKRMFGIQSHKLEIQMINGSLWVRVTNKRENSIQR